VAQLEGLIEQVVQLHYPERWKALEVKSAITSGQETGQKTGLNPVIYRIK
jgi:hypothetical protein